MNKQLRWLLIGALGLAGLIIGVAICFMVAAALYQSDTVKEDVNSLPVVATNTPRPNPPTAERETSPAEPDPREAEYGQFFLSLAENIQGGFTRFSQQNALLSATPSLLLDEAWIGETTAATDIIETEAQRTIEFAEADIPTRFEESHRLLVEAMLLYRDAMQLYRQGVDAQNVDTMTVTTLAEVQALIENGNRLVNEATAAMPTN
jgi:hypothetical protein